MKQEDEIIGEDEYARLSTAGKTIDYVILDKDYVQNMNDKLSSILIGNKDKAKSTKETIDINFDDFGSSS